MISRLCRIVADRIPKKRILQRGDGDRYLERVRLFECRYGGVLLHRFLRPDLDDEVHDHPWSWAVSLILVGGYEEERFLPWSRRHTRTFRPWHVNVLSGHDFHRVSRLLGPDVWTLFIHGPDSKGWGFLHKTEIGWWVHPVKTKPTDKAVTDHEGIIIGVRPGSGG